jgi:hypothetical protein
MLLVRFGFANAAMFNTLFCGIALHCRALCIGYSKGPDDGKLLF